MYKLFFVCLFLFVFVWTILLPPSPHLVAPIDHVYGTLGLVKATTTQQYADISKLREEIEGKGSYTMFAPSNDAWDDLYPVSATMLRNKINTTHTQS